jgi:hypothetical protein
MIGKKDGKKGGEKMMCATSRTPRELVGKKDAHYTIHLPFKDQESKLDSGG